MKVVEIKEKDFNNIVKKDAKVLVDCYASWCGPCKLLSPIIDEVAEETKDCKFYKLNVDEAEKVSKEYGIMSIPTLLLFNNGELKSKTIGLKSKKEIKDIINN